MTPAAFAVLVTMALLLGAAAIGAITVLVMQTRGAGRLQSRLQGQGVDVAGDEFGVTETHSWLTLLARRGRRIERLMDTQGEADRLLVQAGWRDVGARLLFYATQAALPASAVLFALGLWIAGETSGLLLLLETVALIVVSLLAPMWTLRRIAAARRVRIKAEVPLFIHLLVLLFEAGLSTRQAIASLVREGRGVLPELGKEFELVLRSLEAGGDTAEVLRGIGDVLEVPDLAGVLSVLRQVDRYGGEIREPLIDMMKVLEQRRDIDLREAVNRMSGNMTIVMVCFFFPALLIFVAGPAVMALFRAFAEVTTR